MAEGNRLAGIQLASAAAAHQGTSGTGLGSILNVDESRTRHDTVQGEDDERAWTKGQSMTIEQAVALALEEPATTEKN